MSLGREGSIFAVNSCGYTRLWDGCVFGLYLWVTEGFMSDFCEFSTRVRDNMEPENASKEIAEGVWISSL